MSMSSNSPAGLGIIALGVIFLIVSIVLILWDSGRSRKYDGVVDGVVVGHKWIRQSETRFPVAIVEYDVGGTTYTVRQTYRLLIYNNVKHAKQNWEIDNKYRLYCYDPGKCDTIVDPITDWFPIYSRMEVHYVRRNPRKAYCGALGSTAFGSIILAPFGAFLVVFGILLMTVLS